MKQFISLVVIICLSMPITGFATGTNDEPPTNYAAFAIIMVVGLIVTFIVLHIAKKEAIDLQQKWDQLKIGMTDSEVIQLLGKPDDVNRTVGSWGVSEQWVYRFGSSYGGSYLYFENGILTSWQD
jgi:hypothetical protein